MKKWLIVLCIISILISLLSFWLSYLKVENANNKLRILEDTVNKICITPILKYENPEDAIKCFYKIIWDTGYLGHFKIFSRAQYTKINREEILETLEISEIIENGDLAISFSRFSIGSKIYRTTNWLRKIDGFWSIYIGYISKYTDEEDDPIFAGKIDWIEDMLEREEKWEKEGENAWFLK